MSMYLNGEWGSIKDWDEYPNFFVPNEETHAIHARLFDLTRASKTYVLYANGHLVIYPVESEHNRYVTEWFLSKYRAARTSSHITIWRKTAHELISKGTDRVAPRRLYREGHVETIAVIEATKERSRLVFS